jgi:glyoxylase-like metal-dependent hydrolase (beta-lactamase superfamily II)
MSDSEPEEYPDPPAAVESVDPADLGRRLAAGDPVRVLDVRDRDEVETWRVEGPSVTFTQVPYAKFMAAQVRGEVAELAADVAGEGPVTVVCGRGEASDYVAGVLVEAGVEARNLAGGMDAWGRVQLARVVSEEPTVVQYERPATGCLSYAVVDGGEALLIDPLLAHVGEDREDLAGRGADLVAAVDTHLHADHLSGLRALTGGEGSGDAPGANVRRLLPAGIERRNVAYDGETLADGETVTVGGTEVEAVALPGHTTEMTGLLAGEVLLAGDSVFLESVARPDLQEGVEPRDQADELYETLHERLPAVGRDRGGADGGALDPLVAPGHREPETTLRERGYAARLSTLRAEVHALELDREAFVEAVLTDRPRPANVERILAVNRGAETVDSGGSGDGEGKDEDGDGDGDADADSDGEGWFELELGPNNCAV